MRLKIAQISNLPEPNNQTRHNQSIKGKEERNNKH